MFQHRTTLSLFAKLLFLASAVFTLPLSASSHPVSFKNGFGIMSYNSTEMNELLLTYSFSPKIAAAFTFLNIADTEFYIPRANFLIYRANNDDSQANFYLSIGADVEEFKQKSENASLANIFAASIRHSPG